MSRRLLLGGLAALLSFSALALWARNDQGKVQTESRSAADLAPRPGRLLVDIREPEEWKDTGVLAGARLHSWRSPEGFTAAFRGELATADEILLVCRSGNRSNRAAKALSEHLDREVVDVAGGMLRLMREGEARAVAPSRKMGCSVC